MKMNRRKALLGIGSLAVGSGAALGSGAFTSVSANRTVEVSVSNDGSALVGLTPENYASNEEGTVTIDIGSDTGVNDDAVSNLGTVLTLTNNSDSGIVVSLGTGSSSDLGAANDASSAAGSNSQTVSITDGDDTEYARVEFQLEDASDGGGVALDTDGSNDVTAVVYTGDRIESDAPDATDATDTLEIIAQENQNA